MSIIKDTSKLIEVLLIPNFSNLAINIMCDIVTNSADI